MPAAPTHRLTVCALLWGAAAELGACAETRIDAIVSEGGSGGSGGSRRPPPPDPGDGSMDPSPEAGAMGGAGGSDGGALNNDADTVLEPCDEVADAVAPGRYRIRQRENPSCVSAGPPTTVGGEPAFEVRFMPCANAAGEHWELRMTDLDVFEIRNMATDYNLDIRFAATTDGTPAVLFEPHRLYNQRFLVEQAEPGGFRILPRHAEQKCLTRRGERLEIWPCADMTSQTWELLSCPAEP